MELLFSRKWWLMVIRGLLAIMFGLAALIRTGITIHVLVVIIGAFFMAEGIISLVSLFTREGFRRWIPLLLEAIFGIGAGLVAFLWPGITAVAFLYLIVFWAILTGIAEIVFAVSLRKEMKGEWLLILAGGLSVILGVVLALAPGAGIVVVTWLIGIYAIIFGGTLFALGIRMKRFQGQD